MALSKRKRSAIDLVYAAEQKVAEYRGIDEYSFTSKLLRNYSIEGLNWLVEQIEMLLKEELPVASDKQIKYLEFLLSKDYNKHDLDAYNEQIKSGRKLNKYQASRLINRLKTGDNYMYYPNICERDFNELEDQIQLIISKMR